MQVAERDLTVMLDPGLHARPAAELVRTATRFQAEITLVAGARSASAKGLIGLLALGARKGTALHIRAEGPDAEAAVDELARLLTREEAQKGGG